MPFHEKLDFLMNVTRTTNQALAREVSFDASYISRIRSGKRAMPQGRDFLEPAVRYLARNLTDGYRRRVVCETVCPGRCWPSEPDAAEHLLLTWLTTEDPGRVEQLLAELSVPESAQPSAPAPRSGSRFYYGNSGKRQAVLDFLTGVCALDRPVELHLFSEEDMTWMCEDRDFARRWAALLTEFLRKGGHIRIIHTIRRDIGEMLEAVQKWLPLYLSGAIHSYYYPKLRDNIYHRTLFIAPGHAAIVSSSVGSRTEGRVNLFTAESQAVEAFDVEFQDYLSLCRPLVHLFCLQNARSFWQTLEEFDRSSGDLVMMQPLLSWYTMPEEVLESVSRRCPGFADLFRPRLARFRDSLSHGTACLDLIRLPDPELVRSGKLPMLLCDLYGQPDLCYTREEFCLHLKHVILLLKTCPGYRAALPEHLPSGILLLVREGTGAFVARMAQPSALFGLDESRMVDALWEYATRLLSPLPESGEIIAKLEAYLSQLES